MPPSCLTQDAKASGPADSLGTEFTGNVFRVKLPIVISMGMNVEAMVIAR